MRFLEDALGIKSVAELLAALAAFVAIVTGIVSVTTWSRRQKRKATPKPKFPESNLLHGLWDCLDSNLQDAFSLAYNHCHREGRNTIRTRDLFKALVRLNDTNFQLIAARLPKKALPDPLDFSVGLEREVLEKDVCFSNCVSDSLERFTKPSTAKGRPINSADIFVDIAKYGNGESVKHLREYGIGPDQIDDLTKQLAIKVIETKAT